MADYDAYGSHFVNSHLRVYHQGGLDTYCGFYAILNLVNFLKLKEGDYLYRDNFDAFK